MASMYLTPRDHTRLALANQDGYLAHVNALPDAHAMQTLADPPFHQTPEQLDDAHIVLNLAGGRRGPYEFLGQKAMHLLARVLHGTFGRHLEVLHLNNNVINDLGVANLCAAMTHSPMRTLRALWLSTNCFSDRGLQAIFTCSNDGGLPDLRELYLAENRIRATGLHDAVRRMTPTTFATLQMLDLQHQQPASPHAEWDAVYGVLATQLGDKGCLPELRELVMHSSASQKYRELQRVCAQGRHKKLSRDREEEDSVDGGEHSIDLRGEEPVPRNRAFLQDPRKRTCPAQSSSD